MLAVVALCMLIGYKRGLLLTIFGLVSFFLAIFLTRLIYPYVSRFLLQTPLYGHLKQSITDAMGLEPFLQQHTEEQAATVIQALPLPASLKELLQANNTPDMYQLLNVQAVEEYIGGFFASLAINVIAMAVVFILVLVLLRVVGLLLKVIGRFPIIKPLNRIGGLAAGLALGGVMSYITLTILSLLMAITANPQIYALLHHSGVARWLFANNWMIPL
jgi:uncharacterized membrane protein required for colicin V production